MSVETVITVVVIIVYSVGRQLAGEPVRVKRLIGLPAALTVIGIVEVARTKGSAPTHTDIALIAADRDAAGGPPERLALPARPGPQISGCGRNRLTPASS